jgi:hypothetical protein
MARAMLPIHEAYWAYTKPEGECRIWQRHKNLDGYGRMWHHGRFHRAHRLFYETLVGSIPWDTQLHHTCGHRACVNPAHLEAVTPHEHMDKTAKHCKFATHCPKGHSYSEENTRTVWLTKKNGKRYQSRICRECGRTAARAYKRKKMALRGPRPYVPPPMCPQGHLFTPENTSYERHRRNTPKGFVIGRRCRICRRAQDRAGKVNRLHNLTSAQEDS